MLFGHPLPLGAKGNKQRKVILFSKFVNVFVPFVYLMKKLKEITQR